MGVFENLGIGPASLLLVSDEYSFEEMRKEATNDALNKGLIPFLLEPVEFHPKIKEDFPDCTHVMINIFYKKIDSE